MKLPQSISDFFSDYSGITPYLVVCLNIVTAKYNALVASMPKARHYYAIKANPHHEIITHLNKLGAYFECAFINEIDICLTAGVLPDCILYGNPLKKASEIKSAFARGIKQYVFDAELELEKIAINAPGSQVICRIITSGEGAVSPLTIKFGCPTCKAIEWMLSSQELGLVPYGISFHTGSQQLCPTAWEVPIKQTAEIFKAVQECGIATMQVMDIGGGFPVAYRCDVDPVSKFEEAIL